MRIDSTKYSLPRLKNLVYEDSNNLEYTFYTAYAYKERKGSKFLIFSPA